MNDIAKLEALLQVLIDTVWTAHKLRAVGGSSGAVNASGGGTWGVLHTLVREGPCTVPQIARMRPVARQHIQVLANELAGEGLITFEDNPAHKRSKLLVLTGKGAERHAEIKQNMLASLGSIADGAEPGDVAAAERLLAHVMAELDRRIEV